MRLCYRYFLAEQDAKRSELHAAGYLRQAEKLCNSKRDLNVASIEFLLLNYF